MPTTSNKKKPYHLLKNATFAKVPPAEINRGDEVIAIALQALSPLWSPNSTPRIYQSDNFYMCPSLKAANDIIQLSRDNRQKYVDQAFDCDDFAILLKADFSLCSYQNGSRGGGYAFGIVWFERVKPHAMNWMINDDGILRFVEPQGGEILKIEDIVLWGHYSISLAVL
jgi:hypothetical protein